MKQFERELLLKDLSARLPYELQVRCVNLEVGDDNLFTGNWVDSIQTLFGINLLNVETEYTNVMPIICVDEEGQEGCYDLDEIKPYLRPMSSMTEKEREEVKSFTDLCLRPNGHYDYTTLSIMILDFYNSHHFDHRHLIEKGLALEALSGMYKFE